MSRGGEANRRLLEIQTMNTPAAPASDREIVNRRLLDHPPAAVYAAFSDPARLARWWGPAGFVSTIREFDLRPGGHWRLTLHGPDGTDYPNNSVFTEVEMARLIVLQHLDAGHEFELAIRFEECDGKTQIEWRMSFPTKEKCDLIREFVTGANEQNLDRLEAELARQNDPFELSRLFAAPRPILWHAWTDHDVLARWFAASVATKSNGGAERVPGDQLHYCMRLPNGKEIWGKWTFREVEPPVRFRIFMTFSNEQGGFERHPLNATWPLETLAEIFLLPEDGQTRVTLRWHPLNATEEERQTFVSSYEGMKEGWFAKFAQLDTYLAQN